MTDWKEYKLGDVAEIFDGPHATPKKTNSGPVFLGISNLEKGRINMSGVEYLSEKDFIKWTKRVLPKPKDIVFSYETRLGDAAMIPDNLVCCLGRRMGLLRVNLKRADPDFLLYYYLSPNFQSVIEQRKIHGSTVERISIKELPSFPITLPPLATQTAIAEILSSLDDKIELNNQINRELEALAQALFKRWFVDFEFPDAEGVPYKSSGGAMVDSALGEIPLGWRVGTLDEIIIVKGGTTPSTKEPSYWDGEFHWTSPRDLSNLEFPVLLDTDKRITAAGLKKVSSGLLPQGTLLLSSRAPIGYLAVTEIETAINQGYIAINGKNNVSNLFLLYWLKENMNLVIERANGSTFLEISKSSFKEITVIIPSRIIHNEFVSQIELLFSQLILNVKESNKITTLRDTLLPKLISGEVEVSAEVPLENVV